MKVLIAALLLGSLLQAAPPNLTELRPRGAQKGRPFTLTVVGTSLSEGAAIVSSLPATFTPIGLAKTDVENKAASFLVEPTAEWAVGVYPIVAAWRGINKPSLLMEKQLKLGLDLKGGVHLVLRVNTDG